MMNPSDKTLFLTCMNEVLGISDILNYFKKITQLEPDKVGAVHVLRKNLCLLIEGIDSPEDLIQILVLVNRYQNHRAQSKMKANIINFIKHWLDYEQAVQLLSSVQKETTVTHMQQKRAIKIQIANELSKMTKIMYDRKWRLSVITKNSSGVVINRNSRTIDEISSRRFSILNDNWSFLQSVQVHHKDQDGHFIYLRSLHGDHRKFIKFIHPTIFFNVLDSSPFPMEVTFIVLQFV